MSIEDSKGFTPKDAQDVEMAEAIIEDGDDDEFEEERPAPASQVDYSIVDLPEEMRLALARGPLWEGVELESAMGEKKTE